MPTELAQVRADAQELGVDLDDRQAQALLDHLSLLRRWNDTYNLTAVRDPAAMWRQHTLDCLAAVPALRRRLPDAGAGADILDVGSGGGLPGVVWAIALPQARVTCIDAVGKKAAFIRQAAAMLGLRNLQAVHARVEAWQGPRFDLVASRAFGSLADFTAWTRHLLKPGGRWLAMKGRSPDDELQALPAGLGVFHVEPLQVPALDAQRCLVWIERPSSAA